MNLFCLDKKVAIVTGGNKGLGKGMALDLAAAGADIAIVGRDEALNRQTVSEIEALGRQAAAFSVDLRDIKAVYQMVDGVVETFGKVDILVNNAGVSHTKRALDVTEREWDDVMELNVKSLFFCCQAAARKMEKQGYGKIINIASIVGAVGETGISSYTASKAAVINLTRSLALEWARYGIHVNGIGPAYSKTSMNAEALENPKVLEKIIGKTPLKRLSKPSDLTGTLLLLASEAGAFITGQTLFVDGGWLAQ